MSINGTNSIISATLSGETDIVCDNLTANTITLPSGDLQTTLDNIVAGSGTVGPTGPAGADGQDVSFYAPFITTLSAGSSATVSDVITTASNTQNHQLTFNIPRGDKGEQGNQGPQGPQGDKGDKGDTGANGDATAATAAAAAAAVSAAAAAGSALSSSSSAAASAVSAASAASSAASAEATASEIGGRVTYIDVGGSYPNGYTTFNRGGGAEGIRMYNNPTDLTYALRIRNNGTITQTAGSNDFLNTNITGTLTVSSTMTGNLTGSASKIIAKTILEDTDFPLPFLSDLGSSLGLAVNVLTDSVNSISYNPVTEILKCVKFQGDLTGSATKIIAATSTANSDLSIPFLSSSTGSVDILTDIVNGITYNPSTNILKCVTFEGDLSGNSTNSTNATKILATSSPNNTNYNIPFLSAATGNVDILTDSTNNLLYNPLLNTLTVDNLNGKASNVNVTENSTASNFVVPFMSSTSGSAETRCDLLFTFNPYTNVLSTPNIKVENILPTTATLNIGDASTTSTINIEGQSGCEINIGVAAFLNTVNIGNNLSSVNIKGIADTPITVFNAIDQMNGIF
jgi:hypothetical protein